VTRPPAVTFRCALVVAVVALICAGVSFAVGTASGTASKKAASLANSRDQVADVPVTPVIVGPILSGDAVSLGAHLLPPPPGARLTAVAAGSVDIAGVDVGPLLTTIGDKTVVMTGWRLADAADVRTMLIQFAAPSGAIAFVATADQELGATRTVTKHFTIPGIDACFGDDDGDFDASGLRDSTLLCADSTIAIVMSTSTPGGLDDDVEVMALQRQLNALSP
jgi:hypothetical protein